MIDHPRLAVCQSQANAIDRRSTHIQQYRISDFLELELYIFVVERLALEIRNHGQTLHFSILVH
jgi:hypothetical protein